MSKVAIYHRPCPFTEEKTLRLLRDYSIAHEWEIIEYVESNGKGQPILKTLVRDTKFKKFDVVLCHSLLIIGNSLKHILTVMDKIRGCGIGFISLKDRIDMNSSAGSLIDALMNFQKELTGRKIRMGMEVARMRNVLIGRRPTALEKVAKIIEAHKRALSVRDVAKLTQVPKSTCFKVIKDFEKNQAELGRDGQIIGVA